MMLRSNKAMPRSHRIEELVFEALSQSSITRRPKTITIPWNAFVFSTREGKVYLPPNIAKGIALAKAADPSRAKGEKLKVKFTHERGSYFPPERMLQSDLTKSVVGHEVLHFVQDVGSRMLRIAKGLPEERTAEIGHDGRAGLRVGPANKLKSVATWLYGMPKRRSRSQAFPYLGVPLSSEAHGELDVEFMTDALSFAQQAAGQFAFNEDEFALFVRFILDRTSETKRFSPRRLQDFKRTVWEMAVEAHNRKYHTTFSTALTPGVRAILRLPARMVAPARQERPVEPVRPVEPAEVRPVTVAHTGLRIVRSKVDGRPAFCIFRGSENTGKYAFSEAKAKEIMGRMRA